MRAEILKRTVFLLAVSLVGSACAQEIAPVASTGSLIRPDTYRSLVADRRAHSLGDTLTVVVVETASASASANTGDTSAVQFGATGQTPHRTYPYGFGLTGSDDGQGTTSRAGALSAQLTVRVVGIESDGLLRVRGEQSVVVNGERQRIALDGLVREEDIQANNVIASNRISDAHIEFTGKGDVSEAQRRSIVYRFLKWLRIL